MNALRPLAALLAVSLLIVACESKPTIRTNTAPAANLSGYHTYNFVDHPGTDRGGVSTPLTGYFKNAIRREMDSRGYKYVEGGTTDLLVNFNANAKENVDIRSTPGMTYGGGYYGYRGGMYGAGMYSSPSVETVRYKVGTVNVDVVDAAKKELVWEGLIEGKLTDKVMANPQAAVDAVIPQVFANYPGRAAP